MTIKLAAEKLAAESPEVHAVCCDEDDMSSVSMSSSHVAPCSDGCNRGCGV